MIYCKSKYINSLQTANFLFVFIPYRDKRREKSFTVTSNAFNISANEKILSTKLGGFFGNCVYFERCANVHVPVDKFYAELQYRIATR